MKRTKWLALLLTGAMTLSLTACVDEEVEDVSTDVTTDAVTAADNTTDNGDVALEDGSWAVYWYLCGSDLESNGGFATNDLSELMEVELPENVNVVIETGGSAVWQNDLMDADKLQRWLYNSEGLQLVDEQPSASMGEAQTLADFLSFAKENFPAEKTAVVF